MISNTISIQSPIQSPLVALTYVGGICGIAVNEIEGFMAENLTIAEIESAMDSSLCSLLSGSLAKVCDEVVGQLPTVVRYTILTKT